MINVTVTPEGKLRFYTDTEVKAAIKDAEQKLGEKGRHFSSVSSGTEPLLRVMVEGEDADMIQTVANSVADIVRSQLA